MVNVIVPSNKFMVDTYMDWAKAEGVPIYEGFGIDLVEVKAERWERFGVNGAIIHVTGRGDYMTVFLLEIPPGGKTIPQKHIFEAAFYVLAGNGSAVVEGYQGDRHQFEWGVHSVFAPPLNTRYQLFNVSGQRAARPRVTHRLSQTPYF